MIDVVSTPRISRLMMGHVKQAARKEALAVMTWADGWLHPICCDRPFDRSGGRGDCWHLFWASKVEKW